MINDNYIRKAKVLEIKDGDTVIALLDLGYKNFQEVDLRLLDVYAFETKGAQKELGLKDKEGLSLLLPVGTEIIVQTYKTKRGKDKMSFTRYIAEIFLNGESINKKLKKQEQGGIGKK